MPVKASNLKTEINPPSRIRQFIAWPWSQAMGCLFFMQKILKCPLFHFLLFSEEYFYMIVKDESKGPILNDRKKP
ncbi:hypothetical protein DMO16_24015 [Fictibacillus sp. S7]|nr:hypothetical protein DMO16_24015 [Fictibacillus sp. S7]